jgi:hypothetical protein
MSPSYAAVNGAADSKFLIYGLKIGSDYIGDSGGLLSGRSHQQLGRLHRGGAAVFRAITTASVLNSWLMYDRYFAIAPNGTITVKY